MTEKGYVRINAGPDRKKYEHRVVIEKLDREGLCHLQKPLEEAKVHHIDGNKSHNCPQNLLILFDGIHEAFTAPYANQRRWARMKKVGLI